MSSAKTQAESPLSKPLSAARVLLEQTLKSKRENDFYFEILFWLTWLQARDAGQESGRDHPITYPRPLARLIWHLRRQSQVVWPCLDATMKSSLPELFTFTLVLVIRPSRDVAIDEGTDETPFELTSTEFQQFRAMMWKLTLADQDIDLPWRAAWKECQHRRCPQDVPPCKESFLRTLFDKRLTVTEFEDLPGCFVLEVKCLAQDQAIDANKSLQTDFDLCRLLLITTQRFLDFKRPGRVANSPTRLISSLLVPPVFSPFYGRVPDIVDSYRPTRLLRLYETRVDSLAAFVCVPVLCHIWQAEVVVTSSTDVPADCASAPPSSVLSVLKTLRGAANHLYVEFVGHKDLVPQMAEAVFREMQENDLKTKVLLSLVNNELVLPNRGSCSEFELQP